MKHEQTINQSEQIMAGCPLCGVSVPFADVYVTVEGSWRPRIRVAVSGDATDFVAHLWTHRRETTWVE